MGYCRKCGKANVDDARFCEYCGTEFSVKEDTLAETIVAYGSERKEMPKEKTIETVEKPMHTEEPAAPVTNEIAKPKRDKAFYSAKDLLDDVPNVPVTPPEPPKAPETEEPAAPQMKMRREAPAPSEEIFTPDEQSVGFAPMPASAPAAPNPKEETVYSPAEPIPVRSVREIPRSEDEHKLSFEEYDSNMITVARTNPPAGRRQPQASSAPVAHMAPPQPKSVMPEPMPKEPMARSASYHAPMPRASKEDYSEPVLSHRVSKAAEMAGATEDFTVKSKGNKQKKIIIRTTIVCLIALLILTAAGFGIYRLTQLGKTEEATPSGDVITGYRWLAEPYLEAENIDVIPAGQAKIHKAEDDTERWYANEGKKHLYDSLSMICKNGKWGLIDQKGNEVVPAEYDRICGGSENQILMYKNGVCYAYQDGNVKEAADSDTQGAVLIWDKKRDALALKDADGSGKAPYSKEGLYAVRGASPKGSKEKETGSLSYDNYTTNYAVVSDNKRVSDFIYEVAMSENEGLLAVKRNGKWGYVSAEGKEVIPMAYEGVTADYCKIYHSAESENGLSEMAYVPTCGIIAVKKDGKWGYIDKEGKEIIGFIFEEARPLYENKAWVKENGKWGVAEFGDFGSSESSGSSDKKEEDTAKKSEPPEQTKEDISEETIKAAFEKADKIYIDWIYFPMNKAERNGTDKGAVTDENVKSKADLKKLFSDFFSPAVTERFLSHLEPEERDGKLYINVPQGDYGDSYSGRNVKSVKKISDSEYCVTLSVDEFGTTVEKKLLYAKEDNKWGFSDYVENIEKKLSGTWKYKSNESVSMEFGKNGSVKRSVDGEMKEGTYEKIGGDAVRITVPSERAELYELIADNKLVSVDNMRNFWGKENADSKEYDGYFSMMM